MAISQLKEQINPQIDIYELFGSSIKGETINGSILQANTNVAISTQDVRFVAMYLPKNQTITGIGFHQRVQGNYTPSNFNGVALFTFNPTTLTRIAISNDIPTLFTGTAGTFIKVPFTSPIFLNKGVYYGALMWSASSTVVPPQIAFYSNLATGGANSLDLSSGVRITSRITGATSIPTSQLWSGVSPLTSFPYLALYQ
jgi:hypothetical protein